MFKQLASALFFLGPASALAQSGDLPVSGDLLPGWREANGQHMSGVAITLAPGWKTYWRSPGAGGIPPRFNWSGSSNLASVDVRYPIPKVMDQNGLQSIGYDSDVVFPLIIRAKNPDAPVRLQAEIELGVCEEVCIPMTLRLQTSLPAGGSHDPSISASLANQPVQGGAFECDIAPISDGLRLRAETGGAPMKADAAIIEIGAPGVWVSASDMTQTGAALVAEVEMVPPNAQPFALSRQDVRLTLIGDGQAIEMKGCR